MMAAAAQARGMNDRHSGCGKRRRALAKLIAADEAAHRGSWRSMAGTRTRTKAVPRAGCAMLLGGWIEALEAFGADWRQWKDTVILVVTEFGARRVSTAPRARTTAPAPSQSWLAVRSRWTCHRRLAGPRRPQLYRNRDLKPTTDLTLSHERIAADLYGASAPVLADQVFPDSASVRPMRGLVA